MTVTFAKYVDEGSSVVLALKEATMTYQSKKSVYPIPNDTPIIVNLGYEGPVYALAGTIHSLTDYSNLKAWKAGDYIKVTASTYAEFTVNEVWYIDKNILRRTGGTIDTWDVQLTIIKDWGLST